MSSPKPGCGNRILEIVLTREIKVLKRKDDLSHIAQEQENMASLVSGKELLTLIRSETKGGHQLLPGPLLVSSLVPMLLSLETTAGLCEALTATTTGTLGAYCLSAVCDWPCHPWEMPQSYTY